ncbi:MotA/TolQ/ExbB proton channel family protein [Candidatus Entotheonella serta]|nr:MotA/TolQ/ExbB proton channel family protein [Candidatus Entotheonella serta]
MRFWEELDPQLVIGWIERGGVLMWPLILFSILALWIFLERLIHLQRANSDTEQLFETVSEQLANDKPASAYQLVRTFPGPVAAVFQALLLAPPQSKADLEELAMMQARQEHQRLTRRLPLLNLIAGLAPLVGLLGTVVGMVRAFQTVATAQGPVNPNTLAGGIWEALLTTVAGLVVAIPALLFHHYLDQRVRRFAFQMDHYGTALIRMLAHKEHTDA